MELLRGEQPLFIWLKMKEICKWLLHFFLEMSMIVM